ncbi:hypothetical protein Ddc_03175 [Ditylenchus destructor]|nr:hypothetical protein Ddc_03175 [Ditylenchus destructor]
MPLPPFSLRVSSQILLAKIKTDDRWAHHNLAIDEFIIPASQIPVEDRLSAVDENKWIEPRPTTFSFDHASSG